jgi:hypothetical protein
VDLEGKSAPGPFAEQSQTQIVIYLAAVMVWSEGLAE